MINVHSKSKGWLFDDLKQEIAQMGAIASEKPVAGASAYICIRSSEFHLSPKPKKTLVQIHDIKNKIPLGAGHVSFVHPYQYHLSKYEGYYTIDPIGSRHISNISCPSRPVIGFFCKEYGGVKGSDMFFNAVKKARLSANFYVLMIGDNLDHIKKLGKYEQRPANVNDYRRVSCLVTCSQTPMIPLSIYEGIASGREIISTPRQWIGDIRNVRTVYDVNDLAGAIVGHTKDMRQYKPHKPFCRTKWAKTQLQYAKRLCVK